MDLRDLYERGLLDNVYIHVKLWDWDYMKKDDMIGEMVYPMRRVLIGWNVAIGILLRTLTGACPCEVSQRLVRFAGQDIDCTYLALHPASDATSTAAIVNPYLP